MEPQIVILWAVLYCAIVLSGCEAGYCNYPKKCSKTCYRKVSYSTKCGLLGWKRCKRYSSTKYTCYQTCHDRKCCQGYRGTDCADPICDGRNACLNGGRCTSPNTCHCRPGYKKPICTDIDECTDGTAQCSHICTNTQGSFECSCRDGYQLYYDGETCTDINECLIKNGGCAGTCANTEGSFTCSCGEGYAVHSDGLQCIDVDECAVDTSGCGHQCTNTIGSYTCSCRSGYYIGEDEHTCFDTDECLQETYPCSQRCVNEPGTYSCACDDGYLLDVSSNDGACTDVDECSVSNGGCSDTCTNRLGSFACSCEPGYALADDEATCIDVDECSAGTSGCDQNCANLVGSYTCSCDAGFNLHADAHTCENIDDCAGIECHNDGTCMDGIESYTCDCLKGFTDEHCQTDIDECAYLNGGCQHNCTNTFGSFNCSCMEPSYLHANGLHCIGVFEKHGLSSARLPVGDYLLTQETQAASHVTFASTSKWYRLTVDPNIKYTSGIVHIEANNLVLPVSISGLELHIADVLKILSTVTSYTQEDGAEAYVKRHLNETITVEIRDSDIFKFIASNSFGRSFFNGIQSALPDWIRFFNPDNTFLPVSDMTTDIMLGSRVGNIKACRKAPVFHDRMYNVFTLGVDVAFELYEDLDTITPPSDNERTCIVTDISQNGATVFFVFPTRPAFSLPSISSAGGISVHKINGFALSLDKGIKVATDGLTEEKTLEVWNGDHSVDYKVFQSADVWFSGEVSLDTDKLELSVDADLYLEIPNPLNIFTDTFEDKWNIFIDVSDGEGELEDFIDIPFEINDFVLSFGGDDTRQTCGKDANPAGLFGSVSPKIFPFHDWLFIGDLFSETLQLFYMGGEYTVQSTEHVKSEVLRSFDNINQLVDDLMDRIDVCAENFIVDLEVLLLNLGAKLNEIATSMDTFSSSSVNNISTGIDIIESIISNVSDHITENNFCDITTVWDNTVSSISGEIDLVRSQLSSVIQNSANALTSSLQNSDGYGLQYTGGLILKITDDLEIDLGGVSLELVESSGSLGTCGRFHKVYELMKDEKATRYYIECDGGAIIGFFFSISGYGIGVAINEDEDQFILQLTAILDPFKLAGSKYGFTVTVDLFISKKSIYAFAESSFFGLFYVQLEVGVELGDDDWYKLNLHMNGRFVSPSKKDVSPEHTKRSVSNNDNNSFGDLLKDMMKRLFKAVGDFANKRIDDAKRKVTEAQTGLTKAHDWLEDKREIFRKLQGKFDGAVAYLEGKEKDLERAEAVFQGAIDKLSAARDTVDRLCRIEKCRRICIPGIECGWVYARFTRCMISFDDPVCVLKNSLCSVIRAAAFAAYDIAIQALHAPMIVLDVAKSALWVAQVAVDKASSAVQWAEGAIDIAQMGVDAAIYGLEIVKDALDAIKAIIKVGLQVFEFLLDFGVDNVIDVRNCGFALDIDRPIQPIFDVSCEIKPFKTKWITIGMRINFLNPLQSLWQAAKKLVDSLLDNVDVFGRRRRETSQMYMAHIHPLLRNVRDSDDSNMGDFIEEAVSFMNNTYYGTTYNTTDEDYTERVLTYSEKCQSFQTLLSFLRTVLEHLSDVNEDFRSVVTEMDAVSQNMSTYNADMISNITLGSAGVNMTVANEEFNMTDAYVMDAYQVAMQSLYNDTYVVDMLKLAADAQIMMGQQKEGLEKFDFVMEWTVSMNEEVATYFDPNDCVGLMDCMQFTAYTLNTLFINEDDMPDYDNAIGAIDSLETEFLQLVNNTEANIYIVHNSSEAMWDSVNTLTSSCRFCDQAPAIEQDLEDMTAVFGRDIIMTCEATGDSLSYSWVKDGTEIGNETNHQLHLSDLHADNSAEYTCVVTNMIARAVGDVAVLNIIDECPAGSKEMAGYCVECEHGSYQPLPGQQQCITCPDGSTTEAKGSSTQHGCVGQRTSDPDDERPNTVMVVTVTVSSLVAMLSITVAVYLYCKHFTSLRQHKKVPPEVPPEVPPAPANLVRLKTPVLTLPQCEDIEGHDEVYRTKFSSHNYS